MNGDIDNLSQAGPVFRLPISTVVLLLVVCATGIAQAAPPGKAAVLGQPCAESWNRSLDAFVQSGDLGGHGPDIGSEEWKSVVEFKLGVRGKPGVPARDSTAWCHYIDRLVRGTKAPSSR